MRFHILASLLALSACISQSDAVNMGLATACDSKTTVARLGDTANRYALVDSTQICEGNPNEASTDRTITLIDCVVPAELTAVVFRNSRLPARRGANVDFTAVIDQQKSLLRLGVADLNDVRQRLVQAGATATLTPGAGVARCTELARSAGGSL